MSGENAARALMAERVARLREEISAAAKAAGRKEGEISLCAVCKTRSSDTVKESALLPVDLFGENHAQELSLHLEEGAFLGKPVHFIGHLQTNKVKYIADKVCMIHSVDSLKLAKEINKRCEALGRVMDVLVEVNCAGEESKSGVEPGSAEALVCDIINECPALRVRGLMTVAPAAEDPEEVRPYFRQMRELMAEMNSRLEGHILEELSMGMSHDFEIAIEEGATMVRIGTAIFGARDYSK